MILMRFATGDLVFVEKALDELSRALGARRVFDWTLPGARGSIALRTGGILVCSCELALCKHRRALRAHLNADHWEAPPAA